MLYRIFTEDKNRLDVQMIVSDKFDGFTMLYGEGFYKGKPEPTLVIEIDTLNEKEEYYKVIDIANQIRQINQQESVLVQEISAVTFLLHVDS